MAIKSAWKFSSEATCQAIRNEFEILRDLPYHPNVIWVIGGRLGSDPIIVEEKMATDLQNLLDGDGPGLTYREILNISLDAANGLNHLHQNGVVHFDIKPANILLDGDLNAKLADFTCSVLKVTSQISAKPNGTPGYMAPECITEMLRLGRVELRGPNARIHAEKIDVYSLGKVMLVCMTGDLDLESPLGDELCPEVLWRLIRRCTSHDPEARPLCEQVVEEVGGMLTGGCE